MPQLVQADGIGQIEFPDDATPDEISREVNRLDLHNQMQAARSETSNSLGAGLTGLARGFTGVAPGAAKGAGAAMATMPMYASESGFYPEPIVNATENRMQRTPGQVMQDIQADPLYKAGQTAEDYFKQALPLSEQEQRGKAAGIGEGVGQLAGLAATGPLAPVTIGLQSAGEHISADFESGKQAGLSDDAAAEIAMRKAVASGTLQAGIFYALPKPLRTVAEKYLVNTMGQAGFARWLTGRAASIGENTALMTTSHGAENAVGGRPLTEGMGNAALSGAIAGGVLPWLRAKEEPSGQQIADILRKPEPPPMPEVPKAPEPAPAPAPALDQRSIDELLAAMKAQQITGRKPGEVIDVSKPNEQATIPEAVPQAAPSPEPEPQPIPEPTGSAEGTPAEPEAVAGNAPGNEENVPEVAPEEPAEPAPERTPLAELPPRPTLIQRLIDSGRATEQWADKTIENSQGRVSMGLDPALLTAYAVKGAAHIARGARDFTEFTIQMLNEFGETVKPHLQELWNQAASVRQSQIAQRLGEIITQGQRGPLTQELKGERYQLAKESREIQREQAKDPQHVADLLRKMDGLAQQMDHARKSGDGLTFNHAGEEMRGIMEGDLAQVDPKLLNQVYNDLVARKEIMGSNMPELPAGRTLGELTNWLKAQKIDSPKLSLRDRFDLAGRIAEEFDKGKDAITRAADRVSSAWEAFKEQYKHPPIDDDFRRLVKEWFYEKQWTGLETERWINEINRQVPNKTRQGGISIWLDADGNSEVLRSQADLVPPKYKRFWDAALQLTDAEKSIARRIQIDFEQKLEDAKTVGLLDKGREHYGVPQVWRTMPKSDGEFDPFDKSPKTARKPTAKLDPRDPFFALKRSNPTYFDGIMAGGDPKGLEISKLVGLYNAEFHNSLADRGVIKALKDAHDPEGNPLVRISGGAKVTPRENGGRTYFVDSRMPPKENTTKDGRPYQTIDHWALKDWKYASTTEGGNPVVVHGDFLVHPDFYKFLSNELGRSWLRDPDHGGKYFNWLLNSAAFLKASKFASATFHAATIAEHALFHGVWPSVKDVQLDPARDQKLSGLMRNGLELGFGNQRQLFEEGLASHGGLFSHVPGLGDAMAKMSDWLFKDYIPKIKVKTGELILDRNLKRYGGKLSQDQIYELTAQQANAAFGMQNWQLMGTNKTLLDINRLFLTAPDFLLSRSKVVAQALKPYGREQRYFLLAQAALVYGAARALNLLFDDDPHWEAANALSVVYKGRAYSARFLVNDIYHLVTDPWSFAQGRLGPLPRSGIEALTQRDMRTGARINVPFETDSKTLRSAEILVKDMAEWLVPVGTEGFMPGAKGKEQTAPGQVALALAGVGSHKYTAQTQMFDLATKFNRQDKDPKAQLYQRTRDAEAKGDSAYRKLDALLDAEDLKGAKDEFEALQKEGHNAHSISLRYSHVQRPFTGNTAREVQFRASLNPQEKAVYDKAIQERVARKQEFKKLLPDTEQ